MMLETVDSWERTKGFPRVACSPAVLVFDEDMTDLAHHAAPFEARGFEVHRCMSVESALRCVEREELDFAMIDQGSAAFEGRRVIRHLIRYNLRTPFLVIARSREERCFQEALALGAMDYLQKPVPGADIDAIIRECFGNSLPSPTWERFHK